MTTMDLDYLNSDAFGQRLERILERNRDHEVFPRYLEDLAEDLEKNRDVNVASLADALTALGCNLDEFKALLAVMDATASSRTGTLLAWIYGLDVEIVADVEFDRETGLIEVQFKHRPGPGSALM